MNRVKLRNFGLAITATILCSLFAVSAQAATVSDTDDDLTIKLTISPTTIIKNTDAVWGTLSVTITEDDYKRKKVITSNWRSMTMTVFCCVRVILSCGPLISKSRDKNSRPT